MGAAENTKSTYITNLDASPVTPNTIGEGAPGFVRSVSANLAVTGSATSPSTYRLVRIPTNAKIKHVFLNNSAMGTNTAFDVDIYFSDSTNDGTQQSLAGGVVQISGTADNKLFGSAIAMATANAYKEITFINTFTPDMQNTPLWQVLVNLAAAQFTSDPGGFFDIVLKNTAQNYTSGNVYVEVQYVE